MYQPPPYFLPRKGSVILLLLLHAFPLKVLPQQAARFEPATTHWTRKVDSAHAWQEYPRPHFVRKGYWKSLNGNWKYQIEKTSKREPTGIDGDILVPFPLESSLSGVGSRLGSDEYLWYMRLIESPTLEPGEALMLHFGAVDWEAKVFVNGMTVGLHRGGYDGFSYDITSFLSKERGSAQQLYVRVWDPNGVGSQRRGSQDVEPGGGWHTPSSGIWRSVWLEKVPARRFLEVQLLPDVDRSCVAVNISTFPTSVPGAQVVVEISDRGDEISRQVFDAGSLAKGQPGILKIDSPRLWSPESPHLYDARLSLIGQGGKNGEDPILFDQVEMYFGMRKVGFVRDSEGRHRIFLNNSFLFHFGTLDLGLWPDGLYTPPNLEAVIHDITVLKQMGLNTIRKQGKVESAHFYHQCDRLGMIVWQDVPGFSIPKMLPAYEVTRPRHEQMMDPGEQARAELENILHQYRHFPSITMWMPSEREGDYFENMAGEQELAWLDPSMIASAPGKWNDMGRDRVIGIDSYPTITKSSQDGEPGVVEAQDSAGSRGQSLPSSQDEHQTTTSEGKVVAFEGEFFKTGRETRFADPNGIFCGCVCPAFRC